MPQRAWLPPNATIKTRKTPPERHHRLVGDDGGQLIPTLDILAVVWVVYVVYTKRCNMKSQRGLLAAMNRVCEQWVDAILERDYRIVDSQVINGLVSKETFFASTTMLILAGTVASSTPRHWRS